MLVQRSNITVITKPFPESSKNVETEKSFKITRQHTVQIRTVYVMAQKVIPANDFSYVMELQNAYDCEHANIFYT